MMTAAIQAGDFVRQTWPGHLHIVNAQIAETIRLLGGGEAPTFVASTATVKPRAEVDGVVIGEFEAACDGLEQAGAGWRFLASFHISLHHRQIEIIGRSLRVSR